MNSARANAYRHLLYMAMVDIRNSAPRRNPLFWRRGYRHTVQVCAIADSLHNMASASASDFSSFDEERFWNEHDSLCACYPHGDLLRYRRAFEDSLSRGKSGGAAYWPPP